MQVNIYEAKTRLSELVQRASRGESVVIAKGGTPMARLVPLSDAPKRKKLVFGTMKGEIEIAPDFDAPLPDEILDLFEGKGDAKLVAELVKTARFLSAPNAGRGRPAPQGGSSKVAKPHLLEQRKARRR